LGFKHRYIYEPLELLNESKKETYEEKKLAQKFLSKKNFLFEQNLVKNNFCSDNTRVPT